MTPVGDWRQGWVAARAKLLPTALSCKGGWNVSLSRSPARYAACRVARKLAGFRLAGAGSAAGAAAAGLTADRSTEHRSRQEARPGSAAPTARRARPAADR